MIHPGTDDTALLNPQKAAHGTDPAEIQFALTAPQMAIWLDQALHPRKPIYNTGQTLTIGTALDTGLFAKALSTVVAESDALRLRFVRRGAEIVQEIADAAEVDPWLEVRDFSAEIEPEAAAGAWMERIFWTPIAPTDFPLFRFALAKIAADRFIWLQKYHHLIVDATGRQLVAARAAAVYDALRADDDAPPPAEGSGYFLAKAAENAYLASTQYATDEAYWKSRFVDIPEPAVRTDAQASEKRRSGRPTRLDCGLSREQSDALRAFAKSQGLSVFKVLLGLAWCCFSRLYYKPDLVFGVPLANRDGSDAVKRTVGLFSKVMPFRAHLDPALTLGAALAKLDADLGSDFRHRKFPTDHINRMLQLRRADRGGLYDIAVNYVRNDYSFTIGDGAPVSCSNLSAGFAVPWSIMALEYGGADSAIRILVDFDHGRVGLEEAVRFLGWFRTLLSIAPRSADVPIGQLLAGTPEAPLPMHGERETPHLPSETAAVPEAAAGAVRRAPQDEVEQAILDIWQRYFEDRQIGVKDDYFEIGGDSLKAVLVIGECSEHFNVDLPLSLLFERRTVERLAEAVRESVRGELPSRIVQLREDGGSNAAAPSLLLIHPVGGTVFCYRDLVARLAGDAPVYGIQAAGLQAGESLPQSIEEMAEDYLQAAAAVVGSGPVHLAGWSFGGLVAFEMARRFAEAGRPATSLMLIDTPSGLRFLNQDDDDATLRAVAGALGVDLDALAATGSGGIKPTIATIAAAIAASQPGNAAFSEEQIERMVRLIRNARELRRRYVPPRVPGGMTLLRALHEPGSRDEDFDWDRFVDTPVDVVALPATHDSIVRPPHVDVIASILSRRLAGDLG